MRLFELINFEPKDTAAGYKQRMSKTYTPTSKEIGRGHFATAITHDSPKRLNQVKKIGQAGRVGTDDKTGPELTAYVSDDAYLSYLKIIDNYEKQGNSNPYFPVIHNLKIFRKPDGTLDYNIDMEKLVGINYKHLNDNELQMCAVYKRLFNLHGTGDEDPNFHMTAYGICTELRNVVDDENFDLIKDPALKDALLMIRKILKDNRKFRWDLHSNNVMWRMTGNIPQLVLSDPIA